MLVTQDRSAMLQQIITAIQRRWGVRALRRLNQPTDDAVAVIPTGFADLDRVLSIGGIPRGRITEFLGSPTSGMSTMVLRLLARAQAQGDIAVYMDLSRTFDPEYAASVGIDLAALLLLRPPTAADALELMHAMVTSGGVGVLIVDSLAILQSSPRDAPFLAQALRVLPGPLAASPWALIALTMLPYSPALTRSLAASGSLLGHAASLRLHVAREDWLAGGQGLPGSAACLTVLKHRLAAPDGQARVRIHFDGQENRLWR
jgi:recombination protein RecA